MPLVLTIKSKGQVMDAAIQVKAVDIRREVDRACRHPLASPNAFLRGQEIIPDFLASLVRAQGQHHAIVDAIEAREGARAEALAREHARLARRNFRFLRDADPRLATRIPGLSLVTAQ